MVLAFTDDLIFAERIEAVGRAVGAPVAVFRGRDEFSGWVVNGHRVARCLVDLNSAADDPLAVIRSVRTALPEASIVGYCTHVQRELAAQALSAGCVEVLPRSQFVARLPELMGMV